jgi:parallel beta-helix repeat protein
LPNSSAFCHHSSYWFLKINEITSVFRSSVLLLGLTITVASTILSSAFSSTAVAQTQSSQLRTVQGEQTISQVNVLFVNPSAGDDKTGNGGERTPFKTITQALHVAAPQSTIMLAPGTYTEQTGEVFPLILKPGVSIQGDASTKGRGIIIQGGDDYLSRTFGKQNAAIVGANQTSITGITVMNPKPRGYGILIESTNPTISENTFAGSTQDGISITGNATPVISKNYFYQNKANGLTVSGNARPEIRENIFQQTGFGINIAQSAEPLIIGNQIQYNRAGVVVQASSRPKLRNNSIQSNREDGLVVIAQAVPDLGSATEAGGNEFRNNGRYDINASASKQLFSAVGNSIASNRIAGKVDISGNTTPVATAQSVSTPTESSNEITFTAPSPTTNIARNNNLISNRTSRQTLNSQLTPLRPINSQLGTVRAPQPATNDTPQINYVRINPETVEFTAPASASTQLSAPQPLQPIQTRRDNATSLESTNQLGTPNTNNIIQMPTSRMAPMPNNQSSQIATASTGIRYRVLVPTSSERDEDVIRFLAPGAFRTTIRGQGVVQVGVFSNTFNAEQMLRVLNNNGLKGMIEPLN